MALARPRSRSDDEILDGVARAISRVGPAALRLSHVAEETGLAPSTILQRFGSKADLLTAFARRGAAEAGSRLARSKAGETPLEALERGLLSDLSSLATPRALAHHLALFQMDLADPELHASAVLHARRTRRGIRRLLDEAVKKGELRASTDTRALARSVQVVHQGALVTWALYRRKSLKRWVRRELRAVLAPHRLG